MPQAEIEFLDDGAARVSGEITFATAGALYGDWLVKTDKSGQPRIVDLESVSKVDSAGLALLLEWQSIAAKAGSDSEPMGIVNPPDALRKIARLCEAEQHLNLSPKEPRRQSS